jgi:hypothetical protein
MHDEYRGEKDIYYLRSSAERSEYEWRIENGLFLQSIAGSWSPLIVPFVTFVATVDGRLYGMTPDQQKELRQKDWRITFRHSTFFAGEPVGFAGNMTVKDGRLLKIDNQSGHYRPSAYDAIVFFDFLSQQSVNLRKTYIRISLFRHEMRDPVLREKMKKYMPEIIFYEAQSNPELLEKVIQQINFEFQSSGESILLYRAKFIWEFLGLRMREFVSSTAKKYGVTVL